MRNGPLVAPVNGPLFAGVVPQRGVCRSTIVRARYATRPGGGARGVNARGRGPRGVSRPHFLIAVPRFFFSLSEPSNHGACQ